MVQQDTGQSDTAPTFALTANSGGQVSGRVESVAQVTILLQIINLLTFTSELHNFRLQRIIFRATER